MVVLRLSDYDEILLSGIYSYGKFYVQTYYSSLFVYYLLCGINIVKLDVYNYKCLIRFIF